MTTFEIVKILCKERKISINDLEESLGYSKNTLYRLKTQTPGSDKLEAIADYFDVSTDYLLARTEFKRCDNLKVKNESYADKRLHEIINELDEVDKELLIASIENTLLLAKQLAKKM
ncbi:helix-turn-helix transcriptional regulator [Lysinibacillus sp. FSL M8-0216]|uniref:helix-turn-helix domain-containing protein n=1 Tax=Lysinibacillus sp. FSL M8-0216 TaxID=2921619 RepID=UPI00315A64CE